MNQNRPDFLEPGEQGVQRPGRHPIDVGVSRDPAQEHESAPLEGARSASDQRVAPDRPLTPSPHQKKRGGLLLSLALIAALAMGAYVVWGLVSSTSPDPVPPDNQGIHPIE